MLLLYNSREGKSRKKKLNFFLFFDVLALLPTCAHTCEITHTLTFFKCSITCTHVSVGSRKKKILDFAIFRICFTYSKPPSILVRLIYFLFLYFIPFLFQSLFFLFFSAISLMGLFLNFIVSFVFYSIWTLWSFAILSLPPSLVFISLDRVSHIS